MCVNISDLSYFVSVNAYSGVVGKYLALDVFRGWKGRESKENERKGKRIWMFKTFQIG